MGSAAHQLNNSHHQAAAAAAAASFATQWSAAGGGGSVGAGDLSHYGGVVGGLGCVGDPMQGVRNSSSSPWYAASADPRLASTFEY